jgi:hypothetical protein
MSDADSEGSTTSTANSDEESVMSSMTALIEQAAELAELDGALEEMKDALKVLYESFIGFGESLKTMDQPVTHVALDQLSDISTLEASSFRHHTFAVKPPGFASIDINKRYAYKDIVEKLREYLFQEKLVQDDGTIQLNKQLSLMFDIKDKTTTFLHLLKNLKNILV